MFLKTFGWSFGVTVVALLGALVLGGTETLILVVILCVLEISLSFDNAVVNATILERMDGAWRRIFLTVGVLIAVFGMRLLFPLLLVGVTAHLGPIEAVRLALAGGTADEPGTYAALLEQAHPMIAAFGGMFLLMLFLNFVLEDRAVTWLTWLERPLGRIGKLDQMAVAVAIVALVVAAATLAEKPFTAMVAGALGIVTYLVVNALGEALESEGTEDADNIAGIHGDALNVEASIDGAPPKRSAAVAITGRAAFFLFLYLEVVDASFSFDGVIGAFAISQNIFIIAAGLGVGAVYIRSLTVFLVRQGTLAEYVYLEHGAHWAIGALAAILLFSIKYQVPEVVTGIAGVAFIAAAFISSLIRNKKGGLLAAADERREALVEVR